MRRFFRNGMGRIDMTRELALFLGTFTTLLAIINPLEVLPVFLKLLDGADDAMHRAVAWKSSLYALILCFFFLVFGPPLLRLFDVPLSMIRIVGGIILMKIGFELFSPSAQGDAMLAGSADREESNIAFVPLAMPLMFGPGAIATVLGMTSTIRKSPAEEFSAYAAVGVAIVATMLVTYLCLAYADKLTRFLGPLGIDATTRIVGFFVSAIGAGLIFNGVIEALETHGVTSLH
jgi:multiple antibiotic resistance protein